MTKIAVIGHGFVGKAVSNAFIMAGTETLIVDPAETELKIADLPDDLTAAFVCVPTPVSVTGEVDGSIVESVVRQFAERYGPLGSPILVVKSTLTPDKLRELTRLYDDLAFNPEFLTERNALQDFIEPPFHVIGSNQPEVSERVYDLIVNSSISRPAPFWQVSIETASLIKYAVNNFLALKVGFFNELKRVVDSTPGADWQSLRWVVTSDDRVGESHTQVPGPDGKEGFGGACFIKDTAALAAYAEEIGNPMTVLSAAIGINSMRRLVQGIDERESAQHVTKDLLVSLILKHMTKRDD